MPRAKKTSRRKTKARKPAKKPSGARASRERQGPIVVYFWPTPNGLKITVMLEECGLPYIVKPVNIGKGEQFESQFLEISPNNRIPAIVDPNGPGGSAISVFESGAILQYLGRKTGKFYPADERKRVRVDEWLHWQIAGLGPMAGQAHHFRLYAPEKIPYAINRYTIECRRLYGIMNQRLAKREFLCDALSIADFACLGWARRWERQGQDISEFPHLKRWLDTLQARPATARGLKVTAEEYGKIDISKDKDAWKLLFTQGART
jgi:GST-like protein